jgi:hypothetical protein
MPRAVVSLSYFLYPHTHTHTHTHTAQRRLLAQADKARAAEEKLEEKLRAMSRCV